VLGASRLGRTPWSEQVDPTGRDGPGIWVKEAAWSDIFFFFVSNAPQLGSDGMIG